MNIDISKKVVVITGAAKGIGNVLAKRFAQEGAKLSLFDIDVKELKATANSISKLGLNKPLTIKCDVSKEKQVKNAINKTIKKYGTVDVLVANAGILNASKILDTSVDRWDEVFDVNVRGVFLCAREIAPYLKEKRSGRIIFASSFAAIIPSVGSAAYAASK